MTETKLKPAVTLHTTVYRGDHEEEVELSLGMSATTTISELLEILERRREEIGAQGLYDWIEIRVLREPQRWEPSR